MADEEDTPAPPAPPPPAPPPADVCVTLTNYAIVLGEKKPQGKVLLVPAAEATRLIGAGVARESTPLDREIAGI